MAVLAVACRRQVATPVSEISPTAASSTTVPDTEQAVPYTGPGPSPIIDPDPLFQAALDAAQLQIVGRLTDFSRYTVPYDEILSVVPRDGIPPIDNPRFETLEEAEPVMDDLEPLVTFKINGEAKAYPLAIMTWHEIVNDIVGGVPVTVTFYPLCNSALAFKRTLEGRVFDFGVSGKLRNSDLIMWDRQTQTWWQQFTGEAIVGELAGHQLELIPASIISWADFKAANPTALVLSRDTGFDRAYGGNPYAGYDRVLIINSKDVGSTGVFDAERSAVNFQHSAVSFTLRWRGPGARVDRALRYADRENGNPPRSPFTKGGSSSPLLRKGEAQVPPF